MLGKERGKEEKKEISMEIEKNDINKFAIKPIQCFKQN